jgi:hypothetical protein
MIITDQASYSDQIFGLFSLLGYQFSPRPAGLPDQRFWRLDRHADYGPLDRLARHRINIELIIEQWEDILRVAGSLSTGTVRASELIRVLQGGGHPTRLGRAIAEVGRVAKTLHLLSWIDNEEHRRQSSVGLTRHEGRHSVARIIFHGNRGELRQPYREGQADQLGALGFALNALVLWNAQYLDDAIVHLRATGHDITDEDLQRVSPLQHEHIKMLGNFPFTLPHELAAGQRRQLRGLGEPAWRTFLLHYYRKAGPGAPHWLVLIVRPSGPPGCAIIRTWPSPTMSSPAASGPGGSASPRPTPGCPPVPSAACRVCAARRWPTSPASPSTTWRAWSRIAPTARHRPCWRRRPGRCA